jgi:hypothetical protein
MTPITYGDNSRPLWAIIWRTRRAFRTFQALYGLGCAMQELEGRVEKIERELTDNPSQKDFIRFETEVLLSLASRKPDNWADLVVQCVENIRAIMNRKAYKLTRGCCCVFDDNGNIFEACKLHADWEKQAEDRVRIQSLEGMIDILTNGFGKAMPPDESTVDSRKATKRPLGPEEDETL